MTLQKQNLPVFRYRYTSHGFLPLQHYAPCPYCCVGAYRRPDNC